MKAHSEKGEYKSPKAAPAANLKPEQEFMATLRPSAGSAGMRLDKGVKTDGIKIRGTGAATKGVMARGPMA